MGFTFPSSANGTSSRIDHILSHKFSLRALKKLNQFSIFSDHNAVRLERVKGKTVIKPVSVALSENGY